VECKFGFNTKVVILTITSLLTQLSEKPEIMNDASSVLGAANKTHFTLTPSSLQSEHAVTTNQPDSRMNYRMNQSKQGLWSGALVL
jgi:hypothetical protein